jgi:hypothetical protein
MRKRSRLGVVLFGALTVSCWAPPNTTELQLQGIGEPGATVSYGNDSVVLDAQGSGVLTVPRLRVIAEGCCAGPLENVVVDGHGNELTLQVTRGTSSVHLTPQCVPVYTDQGEVDVVELRLQRLVTDGTCWLSNPAVVQRGARRTGSYDPTRFDDAPCGPFQ